MGNTMKLFAIEYVLHIYICDTKNYINITRSKTKIAVFKNQIINKKIKKITR